MSPSWSFSPSPPSVGGLGRLAATFPVPCEHADAHSYPSISSRSCHLATTEWRSVLPPARCPESRSTSSPVSASCTSTRSFLRSYPAKGRGSRNDQSRKATRDCVILDEIGRRQNVRGRSGLACGIGRPILFKANAILAKKGPFRRVPGLSRRIGLCRSSGIAALSTGARDCFAIGS